MLKISPVIVLNKDNPMFIHKLPSIRDVNSIGIKFVMLLAYKWFRRGSFIVLYAFFSIGYGYSTYGKTLRKDHVSSIVILVDHVAYSLLTAVNLTSMYCLWINYEQYKPLIFKLIYYISTKTTSKTNSGIASLILIAIGLVTLLLNTYCFMMFFGWSSFKFYVFKDINFIQLNITLYSLSEFANAQKGMFFDLNEELLSVYKTYLKDAKIATTIDDIDLSAAIITDNLKTNETKIKIIKIYKTPKCLFVIKNITRNHNHLCNFTDDFNCLFGRALFLSIMSIIANIVWSATQLIEYDIRQVAFGKRKPTFQVLACNITVNCTWILAMMGQTILLALIGGALTAEGQKTSTFCYKLLDQLGLQDETKEEALVKEQLMLLAKQAESRCPVLSAAGFYEINLGILGLVAANVFAYAIVAIQFILNEH